MFTSLFAGVVVFSMLGFMAKTLDKDISEVVSGGFGMLKTTDQFRPLTY